MALLPGYQQWGIAVVILFVVPRFVDGVFLGGEYLSANPLAMEYSPKLSLRAVGLEDTFLFLGPL